MKPSYEELEQQLAESHREFRAADATIENLQMQLEKLAAENAGLKAAHPQPFGPVMMKALDAYEKHQDDMPETGMLDAFFILRDSIRVDTTSTDAFLAEVKREATEPLEKEIEGLKKKLLMSVGDIRDLIDYNPETGVLTAKVNFSGRQAGSVIGSQTWQG